ncbi:MAG TPA: hypothetical protein VEG31_01660 [Thermoproteota archaeon]|nr:hypothetical protein [Thermoproteota archaeon]
MPVSPVRDIVSILTGLVLILVVPFALSMSVFSVSAIPITESFQFQIVSGDLSHSYFVSLLGMSQLSYDLLSTQLGIADLLSRIFTVIVSDWAALSVILFLVSGVVAAWALGSDLERIVIPVAIGLLGLAMGVLFIENFIRGIAGLEDFTRMGLANALNMLIVASYGAGTLLSGLTSFGLGRLLHRSAGPTTVSKTTEAGTSKIEVAAKEPTQVTGKEAKPAREAPAAEAEEVLKSSPAQTKTEATETGQIKALSASEVAARAEGEEEILPRVLESSYQPPATQKNEAEVEQVPPPVLPSTPVPLTERPEPTRESREVFTALEEPMQRISSRVEREPGAVWRPIPCPVCGSELAWSREKQAYYCPFCGTVP